MSKQAHPDRQKDDSRGIVKKSELIFAIWGTIIAAVLVACPLAVMEIVQLGPHFTLAVAASVILTIRLTTESCSVLNEWVLRNPRWDEPICRSRKCKLATLTILVLIIPILVGTAVLVREIKETSNQAKAQEAQQTFRTVRYLQPGPPFNEDAVNQTLSELQDSYQSLKGIWTRPRTASRIQVNLFGDIEHYHLESGPDRARGHVRCDDDAPLIEIPLEPAPSAFRDDTPSTTPKHEMVHALMCQSIGFEAFHSIPRWFHEGIAQRYQNEGRVSKIGPRTVNRMAVWWKSNSLLSPRTFCNQHLPEEKEIGTFYQTSFEFIRWLEAKHGINNINQIPEDVRTGANFDDSLQARLGGSCEALYDSWNNSF